MKKYIIILILTTLGLYSCGQSNNTSSDVKELVNTIVLDENLIKTEEFSPESYIHTEADYRDSTGKGIIIQNSYPRGGGLIHIANELQYGHAVFWSRVINKTDEPLELTLNFPADSFSIIPSPTIHFKLLVPPDTMTLDKVSTFSFGLDGVQSFVKSNFYQPSQLKRTIPPNEDAMFYVILLSHLSTADTGIGRTGLFLKEQNLYYKLSVNPTISKLLPCGQLTIKN